METAHGVFKIKAGSMKDTSMEVTVMDVSGKKIVSRVCSGSDEYSFDLSKEHNGLYLIQINSENVSHIKRLLLIE